MLSRVADNVEKLPYGFLAAGGQLKLKMDRTAHTITDLRSTAPFPIAGARAEVTRGEDVDRRFTATRVAAGAAAGMVFLPLALFGLVKKDRTMIYLTVSSADGESVIVQPLKAKLEPKARQFVGEFNSWAAKLAN